MDLREHAHATPGARRHPWETARADFFASVLRASGALPRVRAVLDVGAGDAWLARRLLDACPEGARLVCCDAFYDDAWLARRDDPRVAYVRALPDAPADLVLCLDVAEHVDDDLALMRAAAARVAPEGRLLFSVPAWPALFTAHDTALGHHRRYTPASARRLLAAAGLSVLRGGGLFHSLLAPRAARAALERVVAPTREEAASLAWRGGAAVTAALGAALRADTRVASLASRWGVDVPGLSWWALCGRPC